MLCIEICIINGPTSTLTQLQSRVSFDDTGNEGSKFSVWSLWSPPKKLLLSIEQRNKGITQLGDLKHVGKGHNASTMLYLQWNNFFSCNFSNSEEEAQTICTLRITWTTDVSLASRTFCSPLWFVICFVLFCFLAVLIFLLPSSCPTKSNFSLSYRCITMSVMKSVGLWWHGDSISSAKCLWTLLPNAVTHCSATMQELWKLVIFWTSNFSI